MIPSTLRHLPRWLAIILAALLLLTAGYVLAQEEYTVYVDQTPIQVRGHFETVTEVLAAGDIAWQVGDSIAPPLEAAITPATAIQVRRAKSVTIRTESGSQVYRTHQSRLGAFLRDQGLEVARADQVSADGRALTWRQLESEPVPQVLEIGRFHTVTLLDNGQQSVLRTAAQTVGQVLHEANITLYAADGVEPPAGTWVVPDMRITIQRSNPLTIYVDGRIVQTRSYHANPLDVLAEAGIGLVGYDYTRPGPETPLMAGSIIEVIRVTEDFRLQDTSLPFETLWQATDNLEIDTVGLLQAGEPGIQRQRIRVRYENGVETAQTVDGEWLARPPVPAIMGYGTQIVIRSLPTEQGEIAYWRKVRMRVTAYTAASSGRSLDDPDYGRTASGYQATKGIVAVDPTIIPFRSYVYVPGYGVGYAGDTGGGVKGRWIDLGYDEHNFEWWAGYVDVYYLAPPPAADKINYRLPTWLP